MLAPATKHHTDMSSSATTASNTSTSNNKKKIFMLHDPSGAPLGRFTAPSGGARYAGLKAAAKLCKKAGEEVELHLRETNTKTVRVFKGSCVELTTPTIVKRGSREIVYRRKPRVSFTGRMYTYGGDISSDDAPETASTK